MVIRNAFALVHPPLFSRFSLFDPPPLKNIAVEVKKGLKEEKPVWCTFFATKFTTWIDIKLISFCSEKKCYDYRKQGTYWTWLIFLPWVFFPPKKHKGFKNAKKYFFKWQNWTSFPRLNVKFTFNILKTLKILYHKLF